MYLLKRRFQKFKKYSLTSFPSAPFDYTFADDDFDAKFKNELKISKMATIFSATAIVISCLGLFGLACFVAEQRTKEIGIRRVMGASVFNVWKMLTQDFVALVILSCHHCDSIGLFTDEPLARRLRISHDYVVAHLCHHCMGCSCNHPLHRELPGNFCGAGQSRSKSEI